MLWSRVCDDRGESMVVAGGLFFMERDCRSSDVSTAMMVFLFSTVQKAVLRLLRQPRGVQHDPSVL